MRGEAVVPLCSVSCDTSVFSVGYLSVVWRIYVFINLLFHKTLKAKNNRLLLIQGNSLMANLRFIKSIPYKSSSPFNY